MVTGCEPIMHLSMLCPTSPHQSKVDKGGDLTGNSDPTHGAFELLYHIFYGIRIPLQGLFDLRA